MLNSYRVTSLAHAIRLKMEMERKRTYITFAAVANGSHRESPAGALIAQNNVGSSRNVKKHEGRPASI